MTYSEFNMAMNILKSRLEEGADFETAVQETKDIVFPKKGSYNNV